MLADLNQNSALMTDASRATHILVMLPKWKVLPEKTAFVGRETLLPLMARRKMKADELIASPVSATLKTGALCAWVMVDTTLPAFEQHTHVRKAVQLLLEDTLTEIHIAAYGDNQEKRAAATLGVYAAWINGAVLPTKKMDKKKPARKPLVKIVLQGHNEPDGFASLRAIAEGNCLTRELTTLPPNELNPAAYRALIKKLAAKEGWKYQEYDMKTLAKMGAGAFVAVAQGSDPADAAIVHLQRRVKGAGKTAALVGKGICFDTGGHNLKPARHMHGMHEDMNGSAVALGILLAATRAKLSLNIDCWLAIAQNHISPLAYKQNDIVTALNGTTIEIIHTDAEGRMVLADTLTLAAREKPELLLDFATLTGSMHSALGNRYSGIFSNRESLLDQAIKAGKQSGERVSAFPMDADYEADLDSKVADIKQCSLDAQGDHILAARFLSKFIDNAPWLHMDLSASSNKGGLGIAGTDVTGFGVAWGVEMLRGM